MRSPLINWTSATSRFNKYALGNCEIYKFSMTAMKDFKRVMRRGAALINQQLNHIVQQQIARNREILKSLFLLCGKINIALRGCRDDDPTNATLAGNF